MLLPEKSMFACDLPLLWLSFCSSRWTSTNSRQRPDSVLKPLPLSAVPYACLSKPLETESPPQRGRHRTNEGKNRSPGPLL